METAALFSLLSSMHPLSSDIKEKINSALHQEHYTNKQIILHEGQVSNQLWFIQEGAAMAYVYRNARKIPYWFWDKNDIMVSVKSFFKQVPSEGYIEILEDTTVLSISHSNINQLYNNHPEWQTLIRKLIEKYEDEGMKRIMEYTVLSPGERYKHLMKTFPFIIQKATVESIASYLGISRKTLNRIRAKH